MVLTPPPGPSARLDAQTKMFTEFLASVCRDARFSVGEVLKSGNVPDGPGWVFEATGDDGVTFNVEVAGPAYEFEPE